MNRTTLQINLPVPLEIHSWDSHSALKVEPKPPCNPVCGQTEGQMSMRKRINWGPATEQTHWQTGSPLWRLIQPLLCYPRASYVLSKCLTTETTFSSRTLVEKTILLSQVLMAYGISVRYFITQNSRNSSKREKQAKPAFIQRTRGRDTAQKQSRYPTLWYRGAQYSDRGRTA